MIMRNVSHAELMIRYQMLHDILTAKEKVKNVEILNKMEHGREKKIFMVKNIQHKTFNEAVYKHKQEIDEGKPVHGLDIQHTAEIYQAPQY